MRASVRAGFVPFTAPLEGVTSWAYCDVRGLVTTAIGVLIDPVSTAVHLPWRRKDGTPATTSEVVAEWQRVKARQDWRLRGGGIYKSVATLHLDDDGIAEAVNGKLVTFDMHMSARFSDWEARPADAQLFALSMAWALGGAWPRIFPKCAAAFEAGDYEAAAIHCAISTDGNPGVKPRNVENRKLLKNAAVVAAHGLDASVLYWPRDASAMVAETLPDLPAAPSEPTILAELPRLHDDEPPESTRIHRVADWATVHPRVPLRGDPPDDAA